MSGTYDTRDTHGSHHTSAARPASVGARELKTRLGTYLRQVREGATLIVTDRGKPVAELRPLSLDAGGFEQALARMAARGFLAGEVRERAPLPDFEPVDAGGASASEVILRQREDRF